MDRFSRSTESRGSAQAPRNVLQTQLERANEIGFSVKSGHELEFYLYDAETRELLFDGQHFFATCRNHYCDFINDLMDQLTALDFNLITHTVETVIFLISASRAGLIFIVLLEDGGFRRLSGN